MNHKRITMTSIVLGTLMLVSLFAAVSSAASVSGTTMAGTGPAVAPSGATPPTGFNGWFDFFAVDTSGTLSHGANGNWDSLGGTCTASPAAVSWNSNYYRLDVFVRGSDGAVWQKYYQNGWSGWHSLGGQLAAGTGPAVASWSAGRLDVFAEGANGALYHKWWNGATWSGWESLGGKLTASPAASSQGTNQIGVFVRGTNGACWYKEWTGTAWSSWESLGGQLAPNTGPGVDEALHLFVQGTDNQLWFKSANGAGTAWRTLGGAPPEALSTSSPSAGLPPDDHSMVCVSSTSGTVWYSTISLTGVWDTWSNAGSPA
jgi:hypothetical protein